MFKSYYISIKLVRDCHVPCPEKVHIRGVKDAGVMLVLDATVGKPSSSMPFENCMSSTCGRRLLTLLGFFHNYD